MKKLSKADEMFEFLGYIKSGNERYSREVSNGEYIHIDFIDYDVDKFRQKGWKIEKLPFTPNEHTTITIKLKELGWIDE